MCAIFKRALCAAERFAPSSLQGLTDSMTEVCRSCALKRSRKKVNSEITSEEQVLPQT